MRISDWSSDVCSSDLLVIKALGFDPEDLPTLFDAEELPVTRWGTVRIDWRTMMTPLDGVFAVGDIVRGASLVVWAIRDGRDAAEAVHKYIQGRLTRESGRTAGRTAGRSVAASESLSVAS